MEACKLVNINVWVPFGRFARRRCGNKEGTTYKFYGGQNDGQREGENDAPELPILWYAMILREIIGGRFGGGWSGWRRLHGWAGHTSLSVGEEMSKRKAGWRGVKTEGGIQRKIVETVK
jgi:hypothetical protein